MKSYKDFGHFGGTDKSSLCKTSFLLHMECSVSPFRCLSFLARALASSNSVPFPIPIILQ